MRLGQIMTGLAANPVLGAAAEEMGRLAFLEWLMQLPEQADTRAAAIEALARSHSFVPSSRASEVFLTCLRSVVSGPPLVPRRRGGARRRHCALH